MPLHTMPAGLLPATASSAALHDTHNPRVDNAGESSGSPPVDAETSPASPTNAAALSRRPGKRPAARGTAFYPRKRANTACQVCRARKTKCDNLKPSCSYCLSVGAACLQSPVDLSSFDPASLKILERLEDLERLLREVTAPSTTRNPPFALDHVSNQLVYTAAEDKVRNKEPSPEILRRPSSNSHAQPQEIEAVTKADEPFLHSILPLRVDQILQWALFNDQGQDESPYCLPPDAISTPSAAASAMAGLVDMESHRLYRLLDNFFLYIHCKNPILDEASTRRLVGNALLNGIDWSAASCLAMIICALGCVATPFGNSHQTKPGSQAYQDSQVFFHAAQKRSGDSDFSPDSMEMGRQDTQEQAVYWSAWKSERELRNEISLPDFDIVYSGSTLYPPFFPAPPVPPADSPDGPDSEAQRAKGAWLFYLAEISLRRLTSRLCGEVTKLRQNTPSNLRLLKLLGDMITEYEGQAREWSDNLPLELSIQTPVAEDGISRSVLRGRLINLYEMLYWPFVMASISAAGAGIAVSDSVSRFSRTGLEMHVHQIHVNEPGFFHRHHGSMFMIRACTRSALVLVAAAKSGISMPANWQQSAYNVAGMLAYWEDEDRDLIHWRKALEDELASLNSRTLIDGSYGR